MRRIPARRFCSGRSTWCGRRCWWRWARRRRHICWGSRQPLAGLRGRVHAFRGMQLIVTYHPAFLLRDPRQKKEAWADLQIAMKELGLKRPGAGR